MICLFHLNCSFHCLLTWRSVNLFLKHKWQLSWILFYFCAMSVRNTVVVRNRILPFFFHLELVWKNFLLFYLQTATDLCVWIVCCGFFCVLIFVYFCFIFRSMRLSTRYMPNYGWCFNTIARFWFFLLKTHIIVNAKYSCNAHCSSYHIQSTPLI